MLQKITKAEMLSLISSAHPCWTPDAVNTLAETYIKHMDSRLDEPLYIYVSTGKMTDWRHDEFSILEIRALRHNCSYIDAVILMDAYLKDPARGRYRIMAR